MQHVIVYSSKGKENEELCRLSWDGERIVPEPDNDLAKNLLQSVIVMPKGGSITARRGLPFLENLHRMYSNPYLWVTPLQEEEAKEKV